MKHLGKYRSRQQSIGERGERLFALWATQNGLSPNKVEADYGVDYFCQILNPSADHSELVLGAILAVQVKSTDGQSRPRVRLDKPDAANLLRQTHPTALIAIDLHAATIRYRFIDEGFIDVLGKFLRSSSATLSLRAKMDFYPIDASFRENLTHFIRPGTQFSLRRYDAQRNMRAVVPGARLSVETLQGTPVALVDAPSLRSVMEIATGTAGRGASVLGIVAGHDEFVELPGLALKRELSDLSDLVEGPVIIRADDESAGFVEIRVFRNQEFAFAAFESTQIPNGRAYSHPVGVRLAVFDVQQDNGMWRRGYEASLFRGALPLISAHDVLPLLRLFDGATKILVNGSDVLSEGLMGCLHFLGERVALLEDIIHAVPGLVSDQLFLGDWCDQEFRNSSWIIKALLLDREPLNKWLSLFAFVNDVGVLQHMSIKPILLDVPIIANLGQSGVTLWARMRCSVYCNEADRWAGLRFDEQLSVSVETSPRFVKGIHPEVWTFNGWPPLRLGALKIGVSDAEPSPSEFPVEAKIIDFAVNSV